jgi:hypothetical protein
MGLAELGDVERYENQFRRVSSAFGRRIQACRRVDPHRAHLQVEEAVIIQFSGNCGGLPSRTRRMHKNP